MEAITGHQPRAEDRSERSIGSSLGLYLVVEDVAQRLHCSTRTVHELTRTNSIPHRRLPDLGDAYSAATSSKPGKTGGLSRSATFLEAAES